MAKKMDVRAKFQERMKREGREAEWLAVMKSVRTETGLKFGQAIWEAMKRMGYQGADVENRLYNEYLDAQKAKEDADLREKLGLINQEFEEALKTLPQRADYQAENDWILAHVAMTRRSILPPGQPVRITASDILHADHGPCPSRAAGIKLQHWANKPDEVYKNLAGVVKKPAGDGETTKEEYDEDLAEVERLLKEVS